MKVAYIFPGQGSQRLGMGAELFDKYSALTAKASEILGYSISELCMRDPERKLKETKFTQPALFVVNALTYLDRLDNGMPAPHCVAGHSLGEYNALMAAGAFDFETGLRMVKKRGELMGAVHDGGMAAVVGLNKEEISLLLDKHGLGDLDLANLNTPTQIVLSGRTGDLMRAQPIMEKSGASLYLILPVSAAFHSHYMQEVKSEFERFLSGIRFGRIQIPVIANASARPYDDDSVRMLLASQITSSVRWCESVRCMMTMGVSEFVEVGPGSVLTGLAAKIAEQTVPATLQTVNKEVNRGAVNPEAKPALQPESFGSAAFRGLYNIKYAYYAGSMFKGIASKELVVRMGKARLMGFLGTGGMSFTEIEDCIQYIQKALSAGEAYGMNLLSHPESPTLEEETIALYLKHGIRNVEASAFVQITPSLAWFRLKGLHRDSAGSVIAPHNIIAKLSRPEVAEAFMSPAPEKIVQELFRQGKISRQEAELAREIPISSDVCVEADSGGHTDMGIAHVLMPAMKLIRDRMMQTHRYRNPIRIGAAGGLGTPEAIASAFILGADFVCTGSINQCTIEAGQSAIAKDMLEAMNIQDTAYAPAGDMFEIGARIQVLKRGLFFPVRANKLHALYQHYNSLDEIDEKTRRQIEEKYFRRSFDDVWEDVKIFFEKTAPDLLAHAERSPKQKMALVFRWYFGHTARLALSGSDEQRVDYQIHCGPALGAFNQWVKGTALESWRNRHVDEIGEKLMKSAAEYLTKQCELLGR